MIYHLLWIKCVVNFKNIMLNGDFNFNGNTKNFEVFMNAFKLNWILNWKTLCLDFGISDSHNLISIALRSNWKAMQKQNYIEIPALSIENFLRQISTRILKMMMHLIFMIFKINFLHKHTLIRKTLDLIHFFL